MRTSKMEKYGWQLHFRCQCSEENRKKAIASTGLQAKVKRTLHDIENTEHREFSTIMIKLHLITNFSIQHTIVLILSQFLEVKIQGTDHFFLGFVCGHYLKGTLQILFHSLCSSIALNDKANNTICNTLSPSLLESLSLSLPFFSLTRSRTLEIYDKD